ncbi:MAG: TolC family protein [Betaproteobacteria bacterium]
MTTAWLAVLALCCGGGSLRAAGQPSPPSTSEPAERPQETQLPPGPPPAAQAAPEPPETAGADDAVERIVGPTPGVPTLSLGAAVRRALERSFGLLDAADSVAGARWQQRAALGPFLPQVTPRYLRSDESTVWGADVAQLVPWSGATVTAAGRYTSQPQAPTPYGKTSELSLLLTQPLLRGFGPNASLFELRNARRALAAQQRGYALARQRTALDVARAFYSVIAYRQLLDVARQSLARTETLLRSSEARLEVGMASKLDVFRAQLQAAQARESMVRSETALATALEGFRGLLALAPGETVEPEAAPLPAPDSESEPLELLVRRALERRLELAEARDQVEDARRAASLAKQNLLPQLDLNLGVTQLGVGGSFGDAWRAADRRVQLYVTASYPLQYAQRAASAVAQIQVGSRERGVRQREIEIEQEVRQAARELEQIRKSVELQQQAVEVAARQRRLAVLRYERGLGSNFDVVDAEGSLVTARSALVQLLTSWAVARLDLERTTGSLDVDAEFAP